MSSSESFHRSPEPEQKPKNNKIFVTNLEVTIAKLQSQLWTKFQKYGKLDSVMAKKSFNNEYCFAFIQYNQGEDAFLAVKQLNNTSLLGSRMKVELQDSARRRKGGSQSCFVCGKTGHFARSCRQNKERDSMSRSSEHHKQKSKKKERSSSSSSSSSDSPKKKQKKKKHSKKIKKSKHKKARKHNSQSSD